MNATWEALGLSEVVSVQNLAFGLLICLALFLVDLAVYRLHRSPIAEFPGPKLAALSRWYEFYYDVVLRGQFSNHIAELHRIYGPIIRITPEELHINDPQFFDTLFNKNQRSVKSPWFNGRFNNHHSVFSTCDADRHKIRRDMLNPFFSKRVVGQQEAIVQEKILYACNRISKSIEKDKSVDFSHMWDAFSSDVIMEYSFGFSYNNLKSKDFEGTFHDTFLALSEFGALVCQFPILGTAMEALPERIVRFINPKIDRVLTLCRDLSKEIDHAKVRLSQGKVPDRETVFYGMLRQDVPPEELSSKRMRDEAQTIVGAGLTTTAWSLTTACYYIIENPGIQEKLHQELIEAIPDIFAADAFDYSKLEKLSYLRGCVKEGIRLGIGVSGRMHRVTSAPLPYRGVVIPSGTIVSMNHQDILMNPAIFPCPTEMVPDRWLGHPRAFDGNSLERYFVPFGKGDRQCLGINLAQMEIFIGLAHVFRKFRLELDSTERSDVVMAHDFFLPSPKLDAKGVRIKVMETCK
ncbi:uncharacterized protein PV09_07329 [Verruconis gallopava]|uniref:Cytochrome P450 n=1 Tax=Verruconis gallopava TaxID=253628 RepID=A0A0D2AQ44_9PEZI|nr:uncharacterized protein PV09_07329 [Verruconis gallopava]KIW01289.1 hypothetical protein PV09_07329 [Verruconis gallopava]